MEFSNNTGELKDEIVEKLKEASPLDKFKQPEILTAGNYYETTVSEIFKEMAVAERFKNTPLSVELDLPDLSDLPDVVLMELPNSGETIGDFTDLDKSLELFYLIRMDCSPICGGEWSGVRGDSIWIPDGSSIPLKSNPENLTWSQILEKYGIIGIEFNNGYPDFSPIAVGEVKVENFTTERWKNFAQADEKLAEQWTKEGKDGKEWTAEDVKQWRKENNYTWHECEDCKTLQLVPSEVHNNIPHRGGISEKKEQESKEGISNE